MKNTNIGLPKYRDSLPQLNGKLFLTDGGLETTLIFHDGYDLPNFAAFDLLKTVEGEQRLKAYYQQYTQIALENRVGFVLESATWRASHDWGEMMGYSDMALDVINKQAIDLLESIRQELEAEDSPMVISGCIGPCGDGYDPDEFMSVEQSQAYHAAQIKSFAQSSADMVSAFTMTYVEEAIGIVNAAREQGMPVVISFTVETDGNLPSGQPLQDAIKQVDADTDNAVAYYMVNCAHPEHFKHRLSGDEDWLNRIKGIRANASNKSHAELDECDELDDGNPHELGQAYSEFRKNLSQLNIFGGCCGTDHRHLEKICQEVTAA